MTTYKIKQTSIFLWFISFLLTLFIGFGIIIVLAKTGLIPKGQAWIGAVIIVPIFYLAFKVPRYIATADIELILDQDGLKKRWLKQFIFSNKPDINIKWTEIQDYIIQPDRQFDKFKITLKDGSKFQLFHNKDYDSEDNFLTFCIVLK